MLASETTVAGGNRLAVSTGGTLAAETLSTRRGSNDSTTSRRPAKRLRLLDFSCASVASGGKPAFQLLEGPKQCGDHARQEAEEAKIANLAGLAESGGELLPPGDMSHEPP